ncbi:MAG TPA: methyltransferase domain-containing protein [Terriglobia bacterium]|nr:methyltransferase domain-containing protein [Terriglobia bacterium]
MAIGEEQAAVYCDSGLNRGALKKLLKRVYCRTYGHSDLHTHIRWRALETLLSASWFGVGSSVLEVGCSTGVISFEVARRYRDTKILAVDADQEAIEIADKAKSLNRVTNVEFRVLRVPGLEKFANDTFDVVLLIDVIEHVNEDGILMKEIARVLKPGGMVVISTPTPNYPRVFGRKFHEMIGHVREGYWRRDLEAVLRNAGFGAVRCKPYTYPFSALVCFVFYRGISGLRPLPMLFSPLMNLFSFCDLAWPLRSDRFACSLAMAAVKQDGCPAPAG